MGVYLGSNAVDMQGGFVTGGASGAVLQSKTVSPSESAQTIKADNGYDGLSQVTVNAVSRTVEAYAITDTNPSVSFRRTDGAIKIWGYGTMTSSGGWGQQTTSLIAFAGDKYYKSAMYGGPSSTGLSLSISNGKLSGLPSGLTAISAIVTRGI